MATITLSPPAGLLTGDRGQHYLPCRKDGQVKRRTTWEEKLHVLDPFSPGELTERRLERFMELFCYRRTNASITKDPNDARSWTALRGLLYRDHVIRHLLADRLPTLKTKWIACRSLHTSRFFLLDVDRDRPKKQPLTNKGDLTTNECHPTKSQFRPPVQQHKPSYEQRCQKVESCLALLGINANDRVQVLIQASPSGGRHYYVFLDRAYFLADCQRLLESTGLRFAKGQVEFYPSERVGIRLPFGLMPNHSGPHPWRDWIRFIDDYRHQRIKRHSLSALAENLERAKQDGSFPRNAPQAKTDPVKVEQSLDSANSRDGLPRGDRPPWRSNSATNSDIRYWKLVHDGPKSLVDAAQLLTLGIRQPGTRTAVLKHLAAHLIFFRTFSAGAATKKLTEWAMNPRHQSADIQQDLARGTDVVPKHIARLCAAYAKYRNPSATKSSSTSTNDSAEFARAETNALHSQLTKLPNEERKLQAPFLLHFLRFAKLYGKPVEDADQPGWQATAAVNAVIRKWPGCHHLNYQDRIKAATSLGLLTITKGAWHNPNGKGRARTYHLAIPVVPKNEWMFNYDEAMQQLLTDPVVAPGDQASTLASVANESKFPRNHEEPKHACHRNKRSRNPRACTWPSGERIHPALVRSQGARVRLAPRPRQCAPQPNEDRRTPFTTGRGVWARHGPSLDPLRQAKLRSKCRSEPGRLRLRIWPRTAAWFAFG